MSNGVYNMSMGTSGRRAIWALRYADGRWHAPDHFASSRTADARQAKPFYDEGGRHDAEGFQRLSEGSQVVPHPHPEIWSDDD
jgi:hypothetical protein